jgi:hypothetical protein
MNSYLCKLIKVPLEYLMKMKQASVFHQIQNWKKLYLNIYFCPCHSQVQGCTDYAKHSPSLTLFFYFILFWK